jgi:multidrug efflux system membrane fusion protein
MIRRILLVVFLLAAGALVVWKIKANKREADALTAKSDADANQAIPVSVATVVVKPMPIYLTELGMVTAFNTVTVKSRVDGQLLSVNVREGQAVHQGELLALIDPRPYQAALDQAKGQLVKDEAAADYAKSEAARYTALLDAGVVSKESQQTQVSSAGQSAGALATDRAAIEAAKVNLVYTRIESPINGIVGLRQVDAGNIVHATDTNGLIVVTQLQPISVIFTLPEDQLPEVLKLLHTGHALAVEAFDRAQATHLATGTVLTVDNQIDTTTGTVKVKAVFPNADGALFPNQFVNVRLVLEQRPRSLVVPAAALQSGSNGDFVYVAKPCPAKGCPRPELGPGSDPASAPTDAKFYADLAQVAVDLTEGTQLILKSGVAPGEEVIIDGQEKLKRYSPIVPKAAARAEQGQ